MANRSIAYLTLALLTLGSTQACGLQVARRGERVDPRAATINAQASPQLFGATSQPQLAVEIEVTADTVRPLQGTVVVAPPPANAAIPDLNVVGRGSRGRVVEYSIIDPRLAEIERDGVKVLPAARTFVHVPLSADLERVDIVPVAGRAKVVSKGGSFDPRPLARKACRSARELPACASSLAAKPPRKQHRKSRR
jgi:hypothetical protein